MISYEIDDEKLAPALREDLDALISAGVGCGVDIARRRRLAIWEGQDDSCLKKLQEGEKVEDIRGWPNSPDYPVQIIDDVINQLVDLTLAGFDRAEPGIDPLAIEHSVKAKAKSRLMTWVREKSPGLRHEVELFVNYYHENGSAIYEPGWTREISKRKVKLLMEELDMIVQSNVVTPIDLMEVDTMAKEELEARFNELYQALVIHMSPGIHRDEIGELSESSRKRVLKEYLGYLQNPDGAAKTIEIPIPYVAQNGPVISARRYGEEVFLPAGVTDIRKARIAHIPELYEIGELSQLRREKEWTDEFWREIMQTEGQRLIWDRGTEAYRLSTGGSYVDSSDHRVELITTYRVCEDDDGVPIVEAVLWSPHIDKIGSRSDVDHSHGSLPLIGRKREARSRTFADSRGIPEISRGDAMLMKEFLDAAGRAAQWNTDRPNTVRGSELIERDIRPAPGGRIPMMFDEKFELLSEIGDQNEAHNIVAVLRDGVLARNGLPSQSTDPTVGSAMIQKHIDANLEAVSEAIASTCLMAWRFLSEKEWMDIVGAPKEEFTFEELNSGRGLKLKYQADQLNPERVTEQLELLMKVITALPATSTVNYGQLLRVAFFLILGPTATILMQEEVTTQEQARKDATDQLAKAMLGLDPEVVENDPNAGFKREFVNQVFAQKPGLVDRVQADPNAAEAVGNFLKSLDHMHSQQTDQVRSGITGVKSQNPIVQK